MVHAMHQVRHSNVIAMPAHRQSDIPKPTPVGYVYESMSGHAMRFNGETWDFL